MRGLKTAVALMALTALAAMLGAFMLVVRDGVRVGGLRSAAAVQHADGVWRCNGLRGRDLRDACVLALMAPVPTAPAVQRLP